MQQGSSQEAQARTGAARARPARRGERGQALIVIAMAMIGLLAFIGLTVDAGILFIGVGHLRRAVDAAALAASSQFREGRSLAQQEAAAREVVYLNGVDPTGLELWVCQDRDDPVKLKPHDPALCPEPGAPQRKLVSIVAKTRVRFAFLTIIGFHDTEIVANATSEAASIDVVLAIDTSDSMTSDATDNNMLDPDVCNLVDPVGADDGYPGECHPFEEVKVAAVSFLSRLYFPYDRVAIVTYDHTASLQIPLTNTMTLNEIIDDVKQFPVSSRRVNHVDCTYGTTGDPSGCTNTSIGGGLKFAGNEFGKEPIRQESLWVVILLTDGAANASEPGTGTTNMYCPSSTWAAAPFCRDDDANTRHTVLDPATWQSPPSGFPADPTHTAPYNSTSSYNAADPTLLYDADDFARDMADFVGCAPKIGDAAQWCKDSLNYTTGQGGQGALIFAIGLGEQVVYNSNPNVDDKAAGDSLLRYIANVGIDGNPNPAFGPDLCQSVAVPTLDPAENDSYSCGNYYFSETGTGLTAVFESIASRIFTRLTQ